MAARRSSPVLLLILAVAFLGGGGACVWWGLGLLDRAERSTNWPTVDGVVTSSEVRSSVTKGKRKYWAAVSYQFNVEGHQHRGSTISFGDYRSSSRHEFEAVVARYPVGKQVSVYYDPAAPDSNVLEPGVTLGARVPLIIGLVFAVLGVVFFAVPVIGWIASRPEPPEVFTIE